MTREEVIKKIKSLCHGCVEFPHCVNTDPNCFKALEMAIKALEQEPCEDCISREEVGDYIAEFVNHEYATDRERELVKNIIDGIQHLPSIRSKTDVLDKIRAEIHATAEMHEDGDYYLRDEWIDEIINKYKTESEGKE